jgi:hypothetical protein
VNAKETSWLLTFAATVVVKKLQSMLLFSHASTLHD